MSTLHMSFMVLVTVVQFAGLDDGLLREADAQAEAYASQVYVCTCDLYSLPHPLTSQQDFLRGLESVKKKTAPAFQGS